MDEDPAWYRFQQNRYHSGSEKILADSLEAFIAALYLDRGLTATKRFLLRCFSPYFNQKKLFQVDPNPKSTLQEHIQKKFHILPTYACRQSEKDWFVAWVTIRGKMKTKGEGETKQGAETEAAAKLLRRLNVSKATEKKISSRREIAPRA